MTTHRAWSDRLYIFAGRERRTSYVSWGLNVQYRLPSCLVYSRPGTNAPLETKIKPLRIQYKQATRIYLENTRTA